MEQEQEDRYNEALWDFIGDYKEDLVKEFIGEHQDEFNQFQKDSLGFGSGDIDEEELKKQFCEEMEQEFRDYCEDEWKTSMEVEETDRSYKR